MERKPLLCVGGELLLLRCKRVGDVADDGGDPMGPKSFAGEEPALGRRGAETGRATGEGGLVGVGDVDLPRAGAVGNCVLSSKTPNDAKSVSLSGGAGAEGDMVALSGMFRGGRAARVGAVEPPANNGLRACELATGSRLPEPPRPLLSLLLDPPAAT